MTSSTHDDLLRHADWLGGLARALTGSDADAQDAVQEALMRATTSGARPTGSARAWLAGILRHAIGDAARSRAASDRRERAVARPEARRSALEEVALLERQRLLLTHVEALPEVQRRTVLARYFDGRTPREIAREEGIATATVHSRLRRALANLRDHLDAEFGDRENWAAWLAPIAALGTETRAATLYKVGAAAVLVTLAIGAALVVRNAAPRDEVDSARVEKPSAPSDAALVRVDGLADPADDAVARRTDAARGSHSIAVVRAVDGTPVPGVEVLVLASLSRDQGEDLAWNPDFEGFMERSAERFVTDDAGEVSLGLDPPAIAAVRANGVAGAVQITDAGGGVELRVEETRGFHITVVGKDGERVARDIPLRFEIAAGSRTQPGGPDRYELQRVAISGETTIQDPLGMAGGGPDAESLAPSLEWVAVDIPGAVEAIEGAVRLLNERLLVGGPLRRIELVAPDELGAIALLAEDDTGAPLSGEATATLSFPDAAGPIRPSHAAAMTDGKATWPTVVAAGERVQIVIIQSSTGARWTVTGRAPTESGETVEIVTTAPTSDVVTAILVDEKGAPHANQQVNLVFSHDDERGRKSSISAKSDSNGRVEFALPDKLLPLRATSVALQKSGLFGQRGGYGALQRKPGDLARGGDLGTVVIELRGAARVEGSVVSPEGEPLEGARVSISKSGFAFNHGASTDAAGRFVIKAVLADVETIQVSDDDGRFAEVQRELRPYELEGEVVIRLGKTATMVGSLDARGCPRAAEMIDPSRRSALRVTLAPEGAGPWSRADLALAGDGEMLSVTFQGVHPSAYTAKVALGWSASLVEIPGITVPSGGGTYTVAGLEGLRLADLARFIEVRGTHEGKPVPVEVRVYDAEGRSIVADSAPELLVPAHGGARAAFTSRGLRAIAMPSGLPVDRDRIDLRFEAGDRALVTFLDPHGVHGAGTMFRFELQDSAAAGVDSGYGTIGDGDAVEVSFPERGRYRLYLTKATKSSGPGRVEDAAASRPTNVYIEVEADGQQITIELPDVE